MLLTYQPFFIGGIENVESATRNAYGGMFTFLFTFILSVVYLVQDALKGGGGGNSTGSIRRSSGFQESGGYSDSVPSSRRQSGNNYEGITMMHGAIMQEEPGNFDLPLSVEQAQFS
jgi:hypothetical protein